MGINIVKVKIKSEKLTIASWNTYKKASKFTSLLFIVRISLKWRLI